MLPKKAIKIICIILAGLMILSALSALISVFAIEAPAAASAVPTGDNNADYIAVCLIVPKMKKK